ncbi:hypothetical protein C8R43DRAFT_1191941 [Mycena crocata]|nr:hypothetical protein C8R43DRAFT_1191941 [Mycena crocata]
MWLYGEKWMHIASGLRDKVEGVYGALQRMIGSIRLYLGTGDLCRRPGLYLTKRCFQMKRIPVGNDTTKAAMWELLVMAIADYTNVGVLTCSVADWDTWKRSLAFGLMLCWQLTGELQSLYKSVEERVVPSVTGRVREHNAHVAQASRVETGVQLLKMAWHLGLSEELKKQAGQQAQELDTLEYFKAATVIADGGMEDPRKNSRI